MGWFWVGDGVGEVGLFTGLVTGFVKLVCSLGW